MISRLEEDNLLHVYAKEIFSTKRCSKSSWFRQIEDICDLYSLPQPQTLFQDPPSKNRLKLLIRKKIISYWEQILRDEASALTSLTFFKPQYMSLSRPHPLFVSSGSSKFNVMKASVQAKMLSGRYRCEALVRHWKPGSNGNCLLTPSCTVLEDIPHILQNCPAYQETRNKFLLVRG